MEKGGAGLGVGQRGIATCHLGDVRPGAQAEPREDLADRPAGTQNPFVREPGQDDLRSRKRCGSEQRMHFAAEAPARDDDEALGEDRILVRELHRDPAAQGVADDRRPAVAKDHEQVTEADRVGPERVVALRLRRLPVPEQVRGHDRELLGQHRRHLRPLPVQHDVVLSLELGCPLGESCHRSMKHIPM